MSWIETVQRKEIQKGGFFLNTLNSDSMIVQKEKDYGSNYFAGLLNDRCISQYKSWF